MRLLSLRPDDLLTIPGMALSIDSMRFVSSAHAILATGGLTFTLVGLLPLNTSAFCWTCDWASRSLTTRESELVIMITVVIEEMVGSD